MNLMSSQRILFGSMFLKVKKVGVNMQHNILDQGGIITSRETIAVHCVVLKGEVAGVKFASI